MPDSAKVLKDIRDLPKGGGKGLAKTAQCSLLFYENHAQAKAASLEVEASKYGGENLRVFFFLTLLPYSVYHSKKPLDRPRWTKGLVLFGQARLKAMTNSHSTL